MRFLKEDIIIKRCLNPLTSRAYVPCHLEITQEIELAQVI